MKREFEFLNDVNMDFSEYEELPFTEQERLTMKKNLKQSNKAYYSHKRMMWAAGLAACLAVTSQTAFAKDLAEKIFSLGHSSIMTETETDSADDPLGDVDGAVAFDSVDDMDLSFDLKVPETLPDGFSLTKVYGFSEDDGSVSPDYAVLAYSNGKEGFTIHERQDSEDTSFVTTLPDPQEMDFHGNTAVYSDSEFYANWDGTTISILGNDVLTGDALLEVAESMK